MVKLLGKICCFFLVLVVVTSYATAQETNTTEENLLKKFQNTESALEKFNFFFNTVNRYNENSAYDWLDTVNVYFNSAVKIKDSIAVDHYKIMQSQIYYDLGDYSKSLAIANELYREKHKLDLDKKEILLDLIDDDYSQLQLYDKQIEIRKEKKELGISKNISFYDIYSNLGLHRKAMEDYIMEMKKTVRANDFYGSALYKNNVGNYLRLDKSSSVALNKYKEAKGYIDVFLNDINHVKTEKEIVDGNHLKGIIEGNIGTANPQFFAGVSRFDL